MLKQYKIYLMNCFLVLLCLNVSHAQTTDAPKSGAAAPTSPTNLPSNVTPAPTNPTATTPAATPGLGTAAGAPAPAAGLAPNSVINIEGPITGKFEEYQSICRSREFDKLRYQSKSAFDALIKSLGEQTQNIVSEKSFS